MIVAWNTETLTVGLVVGTTFGDGEHVVCDGGGAPASTRSTLPAPSALTVGVSLEDAPSSRGGEAAAGAGPGAGAGWASGHVRVAVELRGGVVMSGVAVG